MKTYTFKSGRLYVGINVQADEKLGQVVFLGEDGRGRRYEKVSLDRRNPPELKEGRGTPFIVCEAKPRKVTLPANDGKPEKVFYVLENSTTESDAVLVRINTYTDYIKNGRGYWKVIAGQPENLISGYGAFGDAGRIGNWDDGLVVMRPGDVLRVYPSRGSSDALWVSVDGKVQAADWVDYENLMAVEQAEAKMAEADENPDALEMAFATMPAYTWQSGEVKKGISLTNGATGKVVAVGEVGRGRKLTEIPIVGPAPMAPCPHRGYARDSHSHPTTGQWDDPIVRCKTCGVIMPRTGEVSSIDAFGRPVHPADQGEVPGLLLETAVAVLEKKEVPARYSWESPVTKVIYGLTQSGARADGFLVRVSTEGGYTRRGDGKWETHKGNPTLLAEGNGADGDAGRIGSWSDGLWVLREGDVLWVRQGGGNPAYALWVEAGEIRTERWIIWKASDGLKDPAFYVAKGTAPWGQVPNEWLGRVVTIQTVRDDRENWRTSEKTVALDDGDTGELVSINPLVLNLGWDGRDIQFQTVAYGTWVKLETDKTVRRLEGEGLAERETLKVQAEALTVRAKGIVSADYFPMLEKALRDKISRVAVADPEIDYSYSEPSTGNIGLWETEAIRRWIDRAELAMTTLAEAEEAAKGMLNRQNSGEVLVDFEAWHRMGGRTNCGNGWVILPDGTFREHDSDDVRRHKSDGTFHWNLVQSEELALRWSKGRFAGEHYFEVIHLPVGGCTAEQLAVAERLEDEIAATWEGVAGLASGQPSPSIGEGWGLWAHTQVAPEEVPDISQALDEQGNVDLKAAVSLLSARFNGKK